MELRYTEQVFSEKDVCSAGDLIFFKRNVEIYLLARVVILRVNLYLYSILILANACLLFKAGDSFCIILTLIVLYFV